MPVGIVQTEDALTPRLPSQGVDKGDGRFEPQRSGLYIVHLEIEDEVPPPERQGRPVIGAIGRLQQARAVMEGEAALEPREIAVLCNQREAEDIPVEGNRTPHIRDEKQGIDEPHPGHSRHPLHTV